MIVQHVLVPMDFSATADRALVYAIALAQQLQARLTLLHVLDLTPVTMGEMTAGVTATALDTLETRRSTSCRRAWSGYSVPACRAEPPRPGTPTHAIVATAGEQGVDLILMGTHGRTGLAHVFLGSVAEHVIRHAPCPVLVMRKTMDIPDTSATAENALPEQA